VALCEAPEDSLPAAGKLIGRRAGRRRWDTREFQHGFIIQVYYIRLNPIPQFIRAPAKFSNNCDANKKPSFLLRNLLSYFPPPRTKYLLTSTMPTATPATISIQPRNRSSGPSSTPRQRQRTQTPAGGIEAPTARRTPRIEASYRRASPIPCTTNTSCSLISFKRKLPGKVPYPGT
jgi:hypothetical protein